MAQRNIEIVQTKVDIPTILVEHEGRMLPIHSKYNPMAEAERFIDSLAEEIEKSDHLLFYGVGLGYHVKVAQERYPEKVYSVYEPIEEVSNQFVNLADTTGVKLSNLAKNYVELSTDNIIPNIADFSIYFAHRILLITLPVYEKIALNEMQQFNDTYKKIYKEKVGNKQTEKKFNERWAINMMMNVKHTFNTPNLLMQDNNPFEGKPVILAAAGPSLSDEIENLKRIKERGLAYIFAVGSANKALLKHNVVPDAVLSYDPQGTNWHVFEEMMEQNIDTIPLIFCTTVGHETVDYYPGPKTHVVISKDTLTPYLHDAEMVTVNDSSTISNVTFQILKKLNVSKVILVGQNFAYRDNQFYASGIKRYDELTEQHTDGKVKDIEIEKSFSVEDVYGKEVRTNVTFDTMRKEMEFYLSVHQDLVVVNTTKDGAKIAGAPFVTLDELLEQELIKPIVQRGWYEQLHLPKTQLQQKKLTKLENENKKFMELYEGAYEGFSRLKEQANSKDIQKLERLLVRNSKFLDKLHGNLIYKLFIKALADIYTEQIYAEMSLCNKMTDVNEKAKTIGNIHLVYLANLQYIFNLMKIGLNVGLFIPLLNNGELTFYSATCGVFKYSGDWKKKWLAIEKKQKGSLLVNYYKNIMEMSSSHSIIEFEFEGSSLQILGSDFDDKSLSLLVTIDNKTSKVIINNKIFNNCSIQTVFEKKKLNNARHSVKIEILNSNSVFNFLGVRIDNSKGIFHVDEVMNVEDLKVGQRIRIHYKAKDHQIGEFTKLGQLTKDQFLYPTAESKSNGVFYFIMVGELKGIKKLIADRNIQHSISAISLIQQNICSLEGRLLNLKNKNIMIQGKIRLLIDNGVEDNEWDKYIIKFNEEYKVEWNIERNDFGIGASYSWCFTTNGPENKQILRALCNGTENYRDYAQNEIKVPSVGFRPLLEI